MKIWDVLDCKIHLLFIIDYLFGPSWKQNILNQLISQKVSQILLKPAKRAAWETSTLA